MSAWILKCPNCETDNEVIPETVVVECGLAHCHCTCINCKNEFDGQQDYLLWLGLSEAELEGSDI